MILILLYFDKIIYTASISKQLFVCIKYKYRYEIRLSDALLILQEAREKTYLCYA